MTVFTQDWGELGEKTHVRTKDGTGLWAAAPLPPSSQEPGSSQYDSQGPTETSSQGHKCPGEPGMSPYGVGC